jgi:DNA-binding transcriptional regulator YiaG
MAARIGKKPRIKTGPAQRETATGTKIAALRSKLGLPRNKFSRLLGCSERAVANWETGKKMTEACERHVNELVRLQQQLAQVVEASAIPAWLDTPSDAFDGLKPIEVIERGETDRLWRMLFYLESGVSS